MSKVLKKEILQGEQNQGISQLSPEDQVVFDQVRIAVDAAEEKKAQDIAVLRLVAITEFTDYFIICTGNSSRQTQAIVDAVIEELKKIKVRPLNVEGYHNAEWILVDYGTFVLHVFTENSRHFYDLERLWRDAEKIER